MKLRTSSFNSTVFKKDLTRFAPAWAVYFIVLLLILTAAVSDGEAYYRINNVEAFIIVMAWINLAYAALVAQLLFGDLFNSRLCNALHAFPVTREDWFVTHTVAGLMFSLVPNLVLSILAVPVLNLGAGWTAVPLWLLASSLQYLFFFGAAVLCVMLAGNRLGMLASYAIVQFGGVLAYWLASQVYEPLLHGVQMDGTQFYPFSPAAQLTQRGEIFLVDYERILNQMGEFSHYEIYGVAPGEGWGYMAVIALVGIAALVGGLMLYRRRKLECAGDFVAFKAMEPVALVLVSLFMGGFFHLCGDIFGLGIQYVLLATGLVVGYFGCRMLLERTTRVFRKKVFIQCGILLLAFALSLGITLLDPVGITRYQPKAEDVESVTVSDSYSILRHSDCRFTVADPADIENILGAHADCISDRIGFLPDREPTYEDEIFSIHLEYKLKNGKSIHRVYNIHPESDAGQLLKPYFSSVECVTGFSEAQLKQMLPYIYSLHTDGRDANIHDLDGLELEGLLDAIIADCKTGNMNQITAYHGVYVYADAFDPYITSLEFGWDRDAMGEIPGITNYGSIYYRYIRVFESCTNTLTWLYDNGMLTEEMLEELTVKYGGDYVTFPIPTGN